jgi:hypothetical protein
MAPIRRYLRITKYSVLECRIYLDNPSLAESWLLNPRNPILPRVIESIRPLVLPKLREENERSKGKGGKKKGVKDVVVEGEHPALSVRRKLILTEDFEVSIFLTETSTRHSLLTKQKHFHEPKKTGIQSNSSKLTGATNDTAIDVEEAPIIRREDSEEEEAALNLQDIPAAEEALSDTDDLFVSEEEGPRRSKRARRTNTELDDDFSPVPSPETEPLSKRRKEDSEVSPDVVETDDKKKMGMETSYDGFSIYGRVLCLVIKRKDKKGKNPAVIGGQQAMEDWITSTQMPQQEDDG